MKKTLSTAIILLLSLANVMAMTLESDPILQAMTEELGYNMEQLAKKPVPAYFLSLRMTDVQECAITSTYGSSRVADSHQRTITPMVRLGNKELDNYKYDLQGISNPNNRSASGVSVPLDGRPISACRQGIWSETRARYDIAVRRYEDAKTRSLTETEREDKAPCFSDAPVERYYEEELPPMQIDTKKWEGILNRLTTVFKETRQLEQGMATMAFNTTRTYVVNTDGTAVVSNRRVIQLFIQASINANDGMQCPLYESFLAFTEDELPSEEVLMEKTKRLTQRLLALKDAPLADPYSGPALLSSEASGVFFHEIFGHRLESHRMKRDGQTFKKMVGDKVLPTTFNVYCDPTLRYYGKLPLNGHYLYDEEGVKAQRVQNVENGILRNFLSGRIPIDGFPQSNGHGRASGGNDPLSRQSNLIIETTKPYSEAELRQMLIAEAKKQGKEFGYYFRSVTGGYTLTEGLNSFNVQPLEVYRIYVDGRKDELVRGVSLIGTPLAMFSNIEAAGDTPSSFIGVCGAESGQVPVSATSPILYVSKIETQRSDYSKTIPHILPLPEYSKDAPADKKDMIFKAMEDEMQRTKAELKLENQPLPYLVDYSFLYGSATVVTAELGGITLCNTAQNMMTGHVDILLGDKNMTNMRDTQYSGLNFNVLPQSPSYDDMRNALWTTSETAYKNAVRDYAMKLNDKKKVTMPEDDINIPERIEGKPLEHIEESVMTEKIDTTSLKKIAVELSAIFADYPKLYGTSVRVVSQLTDLYRYTSEGLKLRIPASTQMITIDAKMKVEDGSDMTDQLRFVASRPNEFPTLEEMKRDVRNFADLMMQKAAAPAVKEYYIGPIMIEDEAVNEAIQRSIVSSNCRASRDVMNGSSTASVMLGKRITDTNLSVTQISGIKEYKGVPLVATVTVDYDGVAQSASLPIIEKGILKNLLCGRNPAVGATASTGNQLLMAGSHYSRVIPGITRTTFEKSAPMEKMKKLLVSEAKKAGLDHAYIVKAPRNGWRYLVRLDIKTGKEEIVRTSNIPQPTRGDLMHIVAASREEFVANKMEGFYNSIISTITPKAMIVENIEFNFTKPTRTEEFQLTNPMLR